VIIYNLDIFGAGARPTETHPELIIDTDAMLPRTIALQSFQAISRRHSQVLQPARDLRLPELASRYRGDARERPDSFAHCKSPRVRTLDWRVSKEAKPDTETTETKPTETIFTGVSVRMFFGRTLWMS
jgi:hypothetical protein